MNELVVWMADRRAGVLRLKDNGNLQFRYDDDYDGLPISQALPIQREAHGHGVVRATLGGLLPEGDSRETLARNLGLSATNDFRLLESVGGDVAGALTLLSPGDSPPTSPEQHPVTEDELAQILEELPQRPLAVDPDEGIRLSLAGAQPKLPLIIAGDGSLALPANSATPTTHIIKPQPQRFAGLVDNEAFCMDLARASGLSTASVRKASTPSGLPYLVVERYDRDLTTSPIRRLHQEDFCQALAVPSDRKYQQEGGPTFAESADLVRKATQIPALELPRLLAALAFNWIVGNCDAHGKNYLLLYDTGSPVLAPLYDLVSTVAYSELTTRLAMSIGHAQRAEDVNLATWRKLAEDAGYRPDFVQSSVKGLLERTAQEAELLLEREQHKNDSAREIAARVQALKLI